MAVRIRLQRKGRTKAPFYQIVVADSRSPRDGRFIEKIGTYNPLTVPATIEINRERAYYWLNVGAQPTDTVNAILRYKGVRYMKHLLEGVKKGALTQEEADAKLTQWLEQKDQAVGAHRDKTARQKAEMRAKLDGVAKVKPKPVVEEAAPEAPAEDAAAEETVETVAEEAAPEAPAEEAAPEAPASEE